MTNSTGPLLPTAPPPAVGRVYLMGAGPGAGDLLTVRAARLLAHEADVVLVDDLVSQSVLDWVREDARVLKVGKRGGRPSTPQDFIHRLLVRYARRGMTVVRLKGGDPCVFGRGGEEIEALAEVGIAAEIVPGLTAGVSVPAAVGVSVTHRAYTHGVTLVTGTSGSAREPDWAALARSGTTLVVYMGLGRLLSIAGRLIAGGMRPDMPAVAIASGTLPDQAHVKASLAELPEAVASAGLASPVLLVIGEVAQMARQTQEICDTLAPQIEVPLQTRCVA